MHAPAREPRHVVEEDRARRGSRGTRSGTSPMTIEHERRRGTAAARGSARRRGASRRRSVSATLHHQLPRAAAQRDASEREQRDRPGRLQREHPDEVERPCACRGRRRSASARSTRRAAACATRAQPAPGRTSAAASCPEKKRHAVTERRRTPRWSIEPERRDVVEEAEAEADDDGEDDAQRRTRPRVAAVG